MQRWQAAGSLNSSALRPEALLGCRNAGAVAVIVPAELGITLGRVGSGNRPLQDSPSYKKAKPKVETGRVHSLDLFLFLPLSPSAASLAPPVLRSRVLTPAAVGHRYGEPSAGCDDDGVSRHRCPQDSARGRRDLEEAKGGRSGRGVCEEEG